MAWSSMFERIIEALVGGSHRVSLVERRGHYRIPCRRPVSILLPRKAVGGCTLNLSPKGMKVRAHERLPQGREIRLVVSGKKRSEKAPAPTIDLVCRTVWCKYSRLHDAYDAGLEYVPAPGVDLEYVDAFFRHELGLDDMATFQRRCSQRVSTDLNVTCWGLQGTVIRAAVRDLSQEGALFEATETLDVGSSLRIAIDVTGRKTPIYSLGRVVRCRPAPREGWYNIGVVFVEMMEQDRADLHRLILQELKISQGYA